MQVYHWTEWSEAFYKEMMSELLKNKVTASGYPPGITTDAERAAYVLLWDSLGIKLNPDQIRFDGPFREAMKILLNSAC